MCRKCPERKWPVFPTPPSSKVGISIGSANQEWGGKQLPGMGLGGLSTAASLAAGSISMSPGEEGGQPQNIRVGIHLTSLPVSRQGRR